MSSGRRAKGLTELSEKGLFLDTYLRIRIDDVLPLMVLCKVIHSHILTRLCMINYNDL